MPWRTYEREWSSDRRCHVLALAAPTVVIVAVEPVRVRLNNLEVRKRDVRAVEVRGIWGDADTGIILRTGGPVGHEDGDDCSRNGRADQRLVKDAAARVVLGLAMLDPDIQAEARKGALRLGDAQGQEHRNVYEPRGRP